VSDRARWQRLDAILDAVLDLPAAAREQRVRALCADDPDLAAEALRFLADADAAADFLERPAGETAADLVAQAVGRDAPEARLGQRLGAWELTGILGEGGMGVVYAARRADGQYEAEAAVKLMLSLDPHSPLRRRLLEERQILARLDDPRIARLLDGGLSGDGHPYLVMERVEGRTLLEHCAAEGLDLRRRVALFGEVCGAVHAAHRRLVLHCDLKPSNILVTPRGELKLLDFGIARSLADRGGGADGGGAVRLLTPGYASPEQQAGASLTTASDVYGLGVLLHELVTGRRPGDGEAPRGDLGAIMARALAPDPDDRYGTVGDLSDELLRWRRGLPVEAVPDTFAYRLRRRVARNRLATVALAAVTVAVLGGGAVAAWQARIAA
jgi:serine/threonine-protein kinase